MMMECIFTSSTSILLCPHFWPWPLLVIPWPQGCYLDKVVLWSDWCCVAYMCRNGCKYLLEKSHNSLYIYEVYLIFLTLHHTMNQHLLEKNCFFFCSCCFQLLKLVPYYLVYVILDINFFLLLSYSCSGIFCRLCHTWSQILSIPKSSF